VLHLRLTMKLPRYPACDAVVQDDLPKLHRAVQVHRRAALADEGSTSRKHDDEVQLYARSTSWRFEGEICGSCRWHLRRTILHGY